jgi:hypothetical protein
MSPDSMNSTPTRVTRSGSHSGTATAGRLARAQGEGDDTGIDHLRGVLDPGCCAAWCACIGPGGPPTAARRLRDVPALDLASIWNAVGAMLGPACEQRLGMPLLCDLDECWLRCQGGPALAAHGWHQDGALRHDFIAEPEADGALLNMLTCWIALTPCGADAPGLELLARRLPALVPAAQLARVADRHPPEDFLRPELAIGDVLVFGGDTLHRTHVTPTMTAQRISLELRLFPAPALPPRLRGDRAVLLPQAASRARMPSITAL